MHYPISEVIALKWENRFSSTRKNVERRRYPWVRFSLLVTIDLIIQEGAISYVMAMHSGTLTKPELNDWILQEYVAATQVEFVRN